MVQANKNTDRSVRQVVETLAREYGSSHPKAKIDAYRYNPASIRIRIVDPDFKGKNRIERDDIVSAILDKLPDDVQAEITVLLLLSPDETKTSTMNMEFEKPTPSPL